MFVVCIWAKGQQIRKKVDLPPKDFHITLSKHDVHDAEKSITSLVSGAFPEKPSLELLDNLVYTLHLKEDFFSAQEYAIALCLQYPHSPTGSIGLWDTALKLGMHKLSMLAFACAFARLEDSNDDSAK